MKLAHLFLVLLAVVGAASAFQTSSGLSMSLNGRKNPTQKFQPIEFDSSKFGSAAVVAAMPLLLNVQEAAAKGGEYGVWEKKLPALVHPVVMGGLFLSTFYAGYTGLNWRSVRTIAEDIKEMKASAPTLSTGPISFPIAGQLSTAKATLAGGEENAALASDLAILESAAVREMDARIAELTQKRKDLLAGDFRDKHSTMGAAILAMGVGIAVEGPVNTFMRTGKLFPGPHLYAGAGMTAIWALAAALTPAMQRGNNTARSAHIALNTINLGLFVWQVQSGFGILEKVWEKVAW
mmetsp:Transcript_8112/g.12304  ORF Transcript_8112/g.12304 Transcript_8112/m.12304 type:complete len:293 (+) Transcript_8112:60-938(+)